MSDQLDRARLVALTKEIVASFVAHQNMGILMKLLTHEIRTKLEENGREQQAVKCTKDEIDFVPVALPVRPAYEYGLAID